MDNVYIENSCDRLFRELLTASLKASGAAVTALDAPLSILPEQSVICILFLWDDCDKIIQFHETLPVEVAILVIDMDGAEAAMIHKLIRLKRKLAVVSPAISFDLLVQYMDDLWNNCYPWLLSPDIQCRLISYLSDQHEVRRKLSGFTRVERQLIHLGHLGCSIKEMAQKLNLSPNTVAGYRSRMFRKMKVNSMPQLLARIAI